MESNERVQNSEALRDRAKAIYLYLIEKAQKKETTNYEEIAIRFNLPSKGNALSAALSPILYYILEWCRAKGHPHLTALVVRKSGADQGLPGQGFWDVVFPNNATLGRTEKAILLAMIKNDVYSYWNM